MASYHMQINTGGKGTALEHALYIEREGPIHGGAVWRGRGSRSRQHAGVGARGHDGVLEGVG